MEPGRAPIAVVALASVLSGAPAVAQERPMEPAVERDGAVRLKPIGYAQFDVRAFPGWGQAPDGTDLHIGRGEIRRLRLGFEGRWQRLSWEFSGEPIDGAEFLKDAYLDVRLPGSLRLRGGHFKLPGSREVLTAARKLDFVERSALASSIAPARDLGAMITGAVRTLTYRAGVFAGDASSRDSRSGTTAAARVGWRPAKGLELAAWLTEGRVRANGRKHGLEGSTASGYRFFNDVYVRGRRTRTGFDAAWTRGPWQLIGETLRARDQRLGQGALREDLPALIGQGWSASLVRRFGARTDGRWQIGGRYDYLGFDDGGAATGSDSTKARAADVRPRAAHTFTAGAAWKSTPWLRVLGNAGVEHHPDARSAPEPGRRTYFTFVLRLQLETP